MRARFDTAGADMAMLDMAGAGHRHSSVKSPAQHAVLWIVCGGSVTVPGTGHGQKGRVR